MRATTKFAFLLFVTLHLNVFGYVAPNFTGEKIDGSRVSLSDVLKEKRALMLCFWASWCVPCLEELSQLAQGLAKNTDLPLDVLTVNVDTAETNEDVRPTMKAYGLKFPVVLDPSHKIFARYQQQGSLPFSVLINSKGEVVESFNGLHEGMFESLKKKVGELVGASNDKVASLDR
ncbi:MAG: TlpA family protein disulfide reductase [Bdellovibrionaceae bacterium]|nr:TlpA family protein disulfide reductase [Pseudobdellovibrionaceae bacterium]